MPHDKSYTCRMTLHNYDLEVKWKLESGTVKLLEVIVLYSHRINLLEFLSEKSIKSIIDNINFYELGLPK
jgi:hypothetical protein